MTKTDSARYCRSRLHTAIDRQFKRRRRLETAPTTAYARFGFGTSLRSPGRLSALPRRSMLVVAAA